MKIFMTGATGYVGSAVARALLRAGHQVVGLARTDAAVAKLAQLGATALRGELDEPDHLEVAAAEHDASVHCAAAEGPDRATLERTAMEALIAGGREAKVPRVIVMTSGVWAIGETREPKDEDAEVSPVKLSAHRPELEREVIERGDKKLATAVIRPGMLYGGRSGAAAWLTDWIPSWAGLGRACAHVGDGQNRWSMIHHDDMGELYRLVIEKRARGIFHAVEDEPVRVADAAKLLGEVAGLGAPKSWPLEAARAKIGPLAEAIAADIPARARRARELGWTTAHAFSREAKQTFTEYSERKGE
jgi:nucleoside-diphosphate-sugar epimerase